MVLDKHFISWIINDLDVGKLPSLRLCMFDQPISLNEFYKSDNGYYKDYFNLIGIDPNQCIFSDAISSSA
jgi:hypothetical protein